MAIKNKRNAHSKIKCTKCGKLKDLERNFFKIDSPAFSATGRYPVCKECIKDTINIDESTDLYSKSTLARFQDVLRKMDKPFIYDKYAVSISQIENGKNNISMRNLFGIYYKNITSLSLSGLTWNDSQFQRTNDNSGENTQKEEKKIDVVDDIDNFRVTREIVNKWGAGYSKEEYHAFENKYSLLRNNYQEKTAMHREALLTYIRYRVKEEMATAKDDMKAAKDWGQLAQKAASDAKINPSQLSKSDLSDGLDTFGQLVRSVEQAVDIIPILPKFKERPQDKVDFTLLCYINYIRNLKGLPLAKYEDIYQFYEERKKEYADRGLE